MARQDCEVYGVHGGGGAEQGSEAFLRRGMRYATGSGVEHDLVAAHKWLNIAAIRGNPQALRHRREIAAEMTQDQIDDALRQARAWLAVG
jgi:hypothetical protein